MKSLVVGFATCCDCGWESNKFNWHTQFRCPVCGCRNYFNKDYKKEDWFNYEKDHESDGSDGLGTEEGSGIFGDGIPTGGVLPASVPGNRSNLDKVCTLLYRHIVRSEGVC